SRAVRPSAAGGIAGFEGRHRGIWPPWLAGIVCGVPVTRRARARGWRGPAPRGGGARGGLPRRPGPARRGPRATPGAPVGGRGALAARAGRGGGGRGWAAGRGGPAGGPPAGPGAGGRPGLIPGRGGPPPWGAGPRRRPAPARLAGRWAARHRRPERLASTV